LTKKKNHCPQKVEEEEGGETSSKVQAFLRIIGTVIGLVGIFFGFTLDLI
jgi:hypothetical protein